MSQPKTYEDWVQHFKDNPPKLRYTRHGEAYFRGLEGVAVKYSSYSSQEAAFVAGKLHALVDNKH